MSEHFTAVQRLQTEECMYGYIRMGHLKYLSDSLVSYVTRNLEIKPKHIDELLFGSCWNSHFCNLGHQIKDKVV